MGNDFVVTTYRLHTKEKNKLVVIGYFDENDKNENELMVQLDNHSLPIEIQEKEWLLTNQRSKTGKSISKDYFLWVDLPKDWREAKKLRLFNCCEGKRQSALEVEVSRLKRAEEKVFQCVDQGVLSGNGFIVTGWYLDTGDMRVQFFDKAGNELAVNMKRKRRPDVVRLFPENTENEIVGFEAVCKETKTDTVRVHFTASDVEQDYVVRLKENLIEKLWKKASRAYFKAKVYYQQFGMKATLLRVIDKLTGRDEISYTLWFKRHCPTKEILERQAGHKFEYQPKVSIVIPLYKTPHNYLNALLKSIQSQTYANWELCLSDGSGENSPLTEVLREYEAKDQRIKVVYNQKALQISENTNAALEIATGDYIAFADHDDLLAPNALYECVEAVNEDRTIEMIYSDEDKIDMAGKNHFMPHFKSDFNMDMLCSTNYFCHLVVVRKDVLEKAGALNPKFDGAQDYDFVLRCVEETSQIKHIPKILYHWRAHRDSTAENPESKNYAFTAGMRAVQAHYDRVGIKAAVEETIHRGIYRSRYLLQGQPLVSIVIPNKDHVADLDKCIASIEEKSSYKNYEFIIVENNSTEERTFKYYRELETKCPRAKIVYWDKEGFNYPAINNYGVERAGGEYLLFLNNDTEIVNENCLEELLGYCMRADVGAVGARLYYEDGSIQHAGVIIGLGGVAGHAFVGCMHDEPGYFGRIQMAQDYSAVTAACMMVKRAVFEEVGGFDEAYAVAFNDVDLCMKIREKGYLIVYNPYAELNHYESKSRGHEDTDEKIKRFQSEITLFKSRWGEFLKQGDPYYNPNLTLDKNDFSLKA